MKTDQLPEPELGYIKTDKSNQPAFSARQMREMKDTNQLPPLPTPKFTETIRGVPCITVTEHEHLMRSYALQASAQVQGEVCPTCGETEPYTGSCGTSNNDTKALCKKPAIKQAEAQHPATGDPVKPRELELIDGMIAVQLDHAQRCDAISNRDMAEKQKGWDMERVELLRRIRSLGITAHAQKGTNGEIN